MLEILTSSLLDSSGTLTQTGIVIEFASEGDLQGVYKDKDRFSLGLGLKIVAGAAKGLAYMHSMPTPFVHRDIKSMNIMVTKGDNGVEGKVGDCGESRRVDLGASMTQTGSPLWGEALVMGIGLSVRASNTH